MFFLSSLYLSPPVYSFSYLLLLSLLSLLLSSYLLPTVSTLYHYLPLFRYPLLCFSLCTIFLSFTRSETVLVPTSNLTSFAPFILHHPYQPTNNRREALFLHPLYSNFVSSTFSSPLLSSLPSLLHLLSQFSSLSLFFLLPTTVISLAWSTSSTWVLHPNFFNTATRE